MKHTTTPDKFGRLPGELRDLVMLHDYGYDVAAFNRAHSGSYGCQIARTAGSDTTECDTHHASVSHGVPVLLRDH